MNAKYIFDKALKKSLGGKDGDYYSSERVLPGKYYFYHTREQWRCFLCQMDSKHRKAYENGGGKELEERCWNGVWLPPKMAAYASSSYFVYNLLKRTDAVFEQKLPTSIPYATSNMDAFYPRRNVFIEAKCHEIYDSPSPKYKTAYKVFYDMLAARTGFNFHPKEEKNDSAISFSLDDIPITQFDIKQIIAHTLGIANACKNGVMINGHRERLDPNTGVSLVYLLYNPIELKKTLSSEEWKEVQSAYDKEVCFINNHHQFFISLFCLSLEYVGFKPDKIKGLTEKYEFKLADQYNYQEMIGLIDQN